MLSDALLGMQRLPSVATKGIEVASVQMVLKDPRFMIGYLSVCSAHAVCKYCKRVHVCTFT